MQLTFPEPSARQTDPATSWDAARMAKRGAARLRDRCLKALRDAGESGLTDFELADKVGSQQTSAGKRRGELEKAGLVVRTEDRRPSPSGASAMVWRAA